jgi:cell division transport system permease protein
MFDKIEFLISEAFVALRRNGLMTFAAMSTAAIALFLLGGLGYVYFRANQAATNLTGKFELNVFLKDKLTPEQEKTVGDRIQHLVGVRVAEFMPKEKAWQQLQAEHPHEYEGMDNPYPDGFHVTLTDVNKADPVVAQIKAMPEVLEKDGVQYAKDVQKIMSETLNVVRWLGGALGIVLLATSGILIYNAIRLTVIARRREIRIMQLVGASYSTIWTPFVIEGVIQGTVGGVIATLLLGGAQSAFQRFATSFAPVTTTWPSYPLWPILGLLCMVGAGYGFVCSSFAVREPLRIGATIQR